MTRVIKIRKVPAEVRAALKLQAASQGLSFNDYLRDLLAERASRPTVTEVLERAARRVEKSTMSSVDLIRNDRDERS